MNYKANWYDHFEEVPHLKLTFNCQCCCYDRWSRILFLPPPLSYHNHCWISDRIVSFVFYANSSAQHIFDWVPKTHTHSPIHNQIPCDSHHKHTHTRAPHTIAMKLELLIVFVAIHLSEFSVQCRARSLTKCNTISSVSPHLRNAHWMSWRVHFIFVDHRRSNCVAWLHWNSIPVRFPPSPFNRCNKLSDSFHLSLLLAFASTACISISHLPYYTSTLHTNFEYPVVIIAFSAFYSHNFVFRFQTAAILNHCVWMHIVAGLACWWPNQKRYLHLQ